MSESDSHDEKLRRRIALEASRLVSRGLDSQRSRFRAARKLTRGWVPEHELPSHREIRGGFSHLIGDRFDRILELVRPLSNVRLHKANGLEGDVLEQTLQTFERVEAERCFDEELLTAALVHDVGLAIDRKDPLTAGLTALEGLITPRTRWFLESLSVGHAYREGTLGQRARRRLASHEDFEDLLVLCEACRLGYVRGGAYRCVEETIEVLRGLDAGMPEN